MPSKMAVATSKLHCEESCAEAFTKAVSGGSGRPGVEVEVVVVEAVAASALAAEEVGVAT